MPARIFATSASGYKAIELLLLQLFSVLPERWTNAV